MALMLVTYELFRGPRSQYEELYQELKTTPWWHRAE